MSDRIAVMNKGIVEQVAGPEEVYERPATTFVAGFIGVSNLMPGTVRSLSGDRATVELEAGVTVEADGNGLGTGERCHAVVRPEKLIVITRRQRLGHPAGSDAAERRGRRRQLDLPRHGDPARRRAEGRIADDGARPQRRASRPRQQLPGGGADVHLAWTPEHIHLVRESGTERATADHEALGKERQAVSAARCASPAATPSSAQALARRASAARGAWRLRRALGLQRPRRRRPRRADRDREGVRQAERRPDDLASGPPTSTRRRSPTSRTRPASTSTTSRTSTTTTRSSRSSSRRLQQRRPLGPQHDRRHRLDGEEDVRPRLPAELRQERRSRWSTRT